jgi:hypothetical protein
MREQIPQNGNEIIVVIDHEIFSTVNRTVSLLWHLHIEVSVPCESEGN